MTFAAIIELWPTIAEFAVDVGVPYERAKMWRARNSIRAEHFEAIIKAAKARGFHGVTAETLTEAASAAGRNRKAKGSLKLSTLQAA